MLSLTKPKGSITLTFDWETGEWYQGEKPKPKNFEQWLKAGGYKYITFGLILLAVWWWFVGESWIFGDLAKTFTPPKHLW